MSNKNITVLDSLVQAFERTRLLLFTPHGGGVRFWFAAGLMVFLANCGRGGGGGGGMNFNFGFPGGPGGDLSKAIELADKALAVIDTYATWALAFFAVIALFVALWMAVVHWLAARGEFGFIAMAAEPQTMLTSAWESRPASSHSLFLFRMILFAINSVVTIAVLAIIVIFFLRGLLMELAGLPPDAGDSEVLSVFFSTFLKSIFVILPAMLVSLVLMLVHFVANNFVVPIMYSHHATFGQAFTIFRQLFRDTPGVFFIYALVRLLVVLVAATVMGLIACLGCCVTYCLLCCLPIVGHYLFTIAFLPVWMVLLLQPVCFMEQFGPEHRILPEPPVSDDGPPPTPLMPALPDASAGGGPHWQRPQ